MRTQKTSAPKRLKATGSEAREKYRDYNPMPISPLKQQFEPTPAEPVRQHVKMAGC